MFAVILEEEKSEARLLHSQCYETVVLDSSGAAEPSDILVKQNHAAPDVQEVLSHKNCLNY